MSIISQTAGRPALPALVLALAIGCGTTRMTDSSRTATEQLLISNAVDHTISQLDFRYLVGKKVYFDPQYMDGVTDKGYVVSSIRQHLLATGCLLQEDRTKATYVVEARSGGVGTDRHSVLVGIPQMNIPALVPGQPSQIPEIPFAKKTDQNGVSKLAVFAYNRLTGERIWQSGVVESRSTSKDLWVLGAGPFQNGSIRQGTVFAGERIAVPFVDSPNPNQPRLVTTPVVDMAVWGEQMPSPRPTDPLERLGSGPLSSLALAGLVRSRLEAGPRNPPLVKVGSPAPAKAPGPLPQTGWPAQRPREKSIILTNHPER
jgi:Family of unknown function (DUF6655)